MLKYIQCYYNYGQITLSLLSTIGDTGVKRNKYWRTSIGRKYEIFPLEFGPLIKTSIKGNKVYIL